MLAQQWFDIRSHLDAYYLALARLLGTALDYVDAMLTGGEKMGSEFKDRYSELMEIYERAVANRDVIDRLRLERLAVTTETGKVIYGPGFLKTRLASDNWRYFLWEIESLQEKLKFRLSA
jgi:hypothetical protein